MTCAGFGRQGCGAGMRSQRSREGLWSLANDPAGCREAFEGGQTALSKRLESDMHRLWQARLRCRHVQPKVPGRAVEPGQRPCRLPRGGRTALSKRLESDMLRLWQARLRCKHVQPAFETSRQGLWSLADGPAGCREAFEGWQKALSKRLESDMQARLRCRHVQPKVPGRAVEPGQRPESC